MPAELRQQQKFTTRTVSGSHQKEKTIKSSAHGRTRDSHDKCPSTEISGIADKATPLPHI